MSLTITTLVLRCSTLCTSSCGSSRLVFALGRAVERGICTLHTGWFGGEGAADIALASRLQHIYELGELSLVVIQVHQADELADGVVGVVDFVVFGRRNLRRRVWKGVKEKWVGVRLRTFRIPARIELGVLSKLK